LGKDEWIRLVRQAMVDREPPITQAEIARETGIPPNVISRWLGGLHRPNIKHQAAVSWAVKRLGKLDPMDALGPDEVMAVAKLARDLVIADLDKAPEALKRLRTTLQQLGQTGGNGNGT